MAARHVVALGCISMLAGCAPPAPPPAVVAEAPVPPPVVRAPSAVRAQVCISPYRIGRHRAGAGAPLAMTISNDGGWCAHGITREGYALTGGNVVDAPQHGEARIRHLRGRSVIEYRAMPGYVGGDQFSVTMLPGNSVYLVTVTVQP